jgi:hypothetical protein
MRFGDCISGAGHARAIGQNCGCGFSRRGVMTSMAAFAATAVTGTVAPAQTPAAPAVRIVDTHHHFFPPA